MSLRAYRTFQAFILAGLGIYLLNKVLDGRILLYISQRFMLLVLFGALGMLFLAQLLLRERPAPDAEPAEDEHHHADQSADSPRMGWRLWLVALPLLVGLLVPERPLGASALQSRGVNISAGLSVRSGSADQALQLPSTQRSVLDWIRIANEIADASIYEGQPVDVTGFVYHDARLAPGQFIVSRFAVACCVADAIALGMVVDWPEAASLPDNTWVRVQGSVQRLSLEGKTLPRIAARQVENIPALEQPYLFP